MELKAKKGPAGIEKDWRTQHSPAKKKKTPSGGHPDGVVEC
jgi:hypothetical protein